ncbi:holo-(acyl-carrier-protein) synthase [Nautilia profundicola AmH]|uniref:Holo-[acyl-carrier-protein] synthase n=1 Tax=Nautilia profundicola (strain ATCC BAA-1463 / DSM 18972 / AmH) TaxID=598659 RepID=ACPS_NAUPA|nr:holo-ACP synthase [Nautilia profundicola]B9L9S0.1 RecName: Full=Holo-[acyl-carrier-protein] synthase; Short=Holo-ACP synthase; AltName: Full=4'-phosphopantetheinyl transferase AcpS [Nautilia profundicola AmH]ACM92595.1 holo-(acyl-carrier-protein) synthase [Nautilia profundicola AmH]
MIGIDIVSISRIDEMINKFGEKALKRFLNESEILLTKSSQNAAGFWAAKEAFSKALGTGIGSECSFLDIEISKDQKGKPFFTTKTLNKFNIKQADLSISHDGGFAIAAVILLK